LELRQLRHFLAVLEAGSLHRAAKILNISEPALSKSISRLEEFLQVPLLDRHPRGMEPTLFGEAFATHAKLIASELALAQDELGELRGGGRNLLRIAVGPTLAAAMPSIIDSLSAECPGTRLILHEGLFHATISAVVHDAADFGIVPLEEDFDDRDLETEFLAENPLGVVGRTDHALAALEKITTADLAQCRWVVPPRQDHARTIFDSLCARSGFAPTVAAESSSLTFTLSCLRQFDALAFLPHLVARANDWRTFSALPVEQFLWRRKLYIVRRRRKTQTPAARVAIREIRKICRAESESR